jgi:hypothetical protein
MWRNPRDGDWGLRNLERQYHQTGDRELWLKLQQERMRRGLPYERTFVEDAVEKTPGVSYHHGQTLVKTILNNKWEVDTWFDTYTRGDDSEDLIGWTTYVIDAEKDQIGSAVNCGYGEDCARNCHQRKVDEIIQGVIETFSDGWAELPLVDTPPELFD